MREFKVGDKVRIKRNNDIGIVEEKFGNFYRIKIDEDIIGNFYCNEIELVEQEEIIVHCPTQELFDKVQRKMLEVAGWYYSGKSFKDFWGKYREKTHLCLDEYGITCDSTDDGNNAISAEEYLGEKGYYNHKDGSVTIIGNLKINGLDTINSTQQVNKPNNKSMLKCALDVVKKLRLTADEKLLIEYSCISENKNWLEQGIDAIFELEAVKRGYKSIEEMKGRYYNSSDNKITANIFEFDDMVKEHLPKLIENLKKDKAEVKKK